MKKYIMLTTVLTLTACSNLAKKSGYHKPKEEVISRIDDLGSRPAWVSESEPFQIKENIVSNVGMTTVPADSRIEAAYRIAGNNGKAEISKAVEQRLSFVFQNAEEGVSMDATQARSIGAEASEITSSSFRISKQYWEKVFAVDEHGASNTFYRVYSLVTMPEQDFKKAVLEAANKRAGKGLSIEFAKQVTQHWDKFVNPEARASASEQ